MVKPNWGIIPPYPEQLDHNNCGQKKKGGGGEGLFLNPVSSRTKFPVQPHKELHGHNDKDMQMITEDPKWDQTKMSTLKCKTLSFGTAASDTASSEISVFSAFPQQKHQVGRRTRMSVPSSDCSSTPRLWTSVAVRLLKARPFQQGEMAVHARGMTGQS